MRLFIGSFLVLLLSELADGDVVKFKNGGELEGIVLGQSEKAVTLKLSYATVTIDRSDIISIEISKGNEVRQKLKSRVANWSQCITVASSRLWAKSLRQIPSVVIDFGVMQFVPYKSHASGDYEFNIYGDSDDPAGIEIGIYGSLLKDAAARKECIAVMSQLLRDEGDIKILKALSHNKDRVERDGITFEITPSTDIDAFGGWWVSIYTKAKLEAQRAKSEELKAITVKREAVEKRPRRAPSATPKTTSSAYSLSPWSSTDFSYSRRKTTRSSSSGTVYVRGYYRKDGTYVRSHTRRRPRR